MTIAVLVSGHGYGHATRMAVLAAELRRLSGGRVVVFSDSAARHFRQEAPELEVLPGVPDPGVLQSDGLTEDWGATLEAHEALAHGWDAAAEDAARRLRASGATLVVGDIPPLAFEAAHRAGIPAAAIGNFSWDWIFAARESAEPRWTPIVSRYREAYGRGEVLFRLPLSADFGAAFRREEASPLLVRRPRWSREEARARAGLAGETRRLVILSFGGFGGGRLRPRGDLGGTLFLGFGPAPEGLEGSWKDAEPLMEEMRHVDLAAACDALIGKVGYGTIAESLALRLPMLYVPRDSYPEGAPLVEGIRTMGRGRPLPAADFTAGRWGPALDALLSERGDWPAVRLDGAQFLAERLLALADRARSSK